MDQIIMTPIKPLSWGNHVSPAFRERVYLLCDHLGWTEDHASWLMAAMAFETGRTFSPSIRNKASSATGLIQFMRRTALNLKTTVNRLAAMTAEQQLDYVEAYFRAQPYQRIDTLMDLYMAILWPAAIGRGADYVLFDGASYQANKGLDRNKDRRVTKWEAASPVRERLAEGFKPGNIWLPPNAKHQKG